MKRIAYLLLASLALLICSCNVSAPDVVQLDSTEFSIPKTLTISIQEPRTRMTVGELDPATGTYPVMLTPYNYYYGTGDVFYLIGGHGDIADFRMDEVTLYGSYNVASVTGSIATLDLQSMPDAFGNEYVNSDFFILTSDYSVTVDQADDGDLATGIVFATWFTKTELQRLLAEAAEKPSALPMYALTSLLKIHVSFPELDHELRLTGVAAQTPGICPRKYIDFSKMPQMIAENTIYGDHSGYDYTWTYLDQTISSGGETDVYVSFDPGSYETLHLEFRMADDVFNYNVQIDSKSGFEVKGGYLYKTRLSLSNELFMAGRELIPVLAIGGKTFRFTDPDDMNAKPLRERLATSPVVLAGYGLESDFSGDLDVRGKVVVVSRGEITFSDKIANAKEAGAVGIIIYNNQPGEIYMDLSSLSGQDPIPAVATTQDFGQYLSSHPDDKVALWMYITDMENALGK